MPLLREATRCLRIRLTAKRVADTAENVKPYPHILLTSTSALSTLTGAHGRAMYGNLLSALNKHRLNPSPESLAEITEASAFLERETRTPKARAFEAAVAIALTEDAQEKQALGRILFAELLETSYDDRELLSLRRSFTRELAGAQPQPTEFLAHAV